MNSLLAVLGARSLYGLPFQYGKNTLQNKSTNKIVSSLEKGQHIFSVNYTPKNNLVQNNLAYFLTERYCIWNVFRNRIIKVPIRHSHWNLQDDRKSTRLNSSHVAISYAVFCLK